MRGGIIVAATLGSEHLWLLKSPDYAYNHPPFTPNYKILS